MQKDIEEPISSRNKWALTGALLVGTFLASIEVTVVAAAMPSIVQSLGGLALYPWVFSAYLLTQTVTIPLYGRLADLYGRRPIYIVGVTLFLVGSAICGLAPRMGILVLARAIQGLGAGSVLPLTMTIFGDLFDVSVRTKLQGLFALVWGFSSIVGPLVGGVIVLNLSWRWVFFLNLPFGLISALAVALLLRERPLRREHRLDVSGALMLTAATLLLLVGLLPEDQRPVSLPPAAWLMFSVTFVLLFTRIEIRHPEPLVPLNLFRDRVQIAANATGVLLGAVLFGIVSYLPLYVQGVKGGTPVHAGAILIPLSLGWSVASIVGGRIVWQVGFQFLVRTGCLLVAVGSGLAFAGIWTDQLLLGICGEIVYGLGMGSCISSFTVSVQERVPKTRRGIATALTQFSRSIGGAVGVALLGAIFSSSLPTELGTQPEGFSGESLALGLTPVFESIFLVAVVAGLFGFIIFPRVEEGMVAAAAVRSSSNRA